MFFTLTHITKQNIVCLYICFVYIKFALWKNILSIKDVSSFMFSKMQFNVYSFMLFFIIIPMSMVSSFILRIIRKRRYRV